MSDTIWTVGHSTHEPDALISLLDGAGIRRVVDIRRFPGSRRHPRLAREQMQEWFPAAGIAYEWWEALGGRRRVAPDSVNTALRNDAFRGYADYMQTAAFTVALDDLFTTAGTTPSTVMCAEAVWWRCHRRLVADALTLVHGVDVIHLMPGGALRPHRVTEGARRAGHTVRYDGGAVSLWSDNGGDDPSPTEPAG